MMQVLQVVVVGVIGHLYALKLSFTLEIVEIRSINQAQIIAQLVTQLLVNFIIILDTIQKWNSDVEAGEPLVDDCPENSREEREETKDAEESGKAHLAPSQ